MSVDKSWRLGSPGSLIYGVYDSARKQLNRYLVGYLMSQVRSRSRSIILEAGCGTGYASSVIAKYPDVSLSIGLDYDIEAVSQARRRDPSLPIVVADLRALPFKAGCIDLVWNSSTLEHLPAPQAALKELYRVARTEGLVFVGVPYVYGPLGFQRWLPHTAVGVWLGTVFDRPSLQRLFEENGLQPIDTLTYFFRFFIGVLARKTAKPWGEAS
jgi:SAM-dependent methyltransferase